MDGSLEALDNVLGLQVLGKDLVEGDKLTTGHVSFQLLASLEGLINDLLELLLDQSRGWLADIHGLIELWHLSGVVFRVLGIGNAKLSKALTEAALTFLNGCVSQHIQVVNLLGS